MKIAILDDDHRISKKIKDSIITAYPKADVLVFSNIDAIQRWTQTDTCDLMIIDVLVGHDSGIDFVKELRRNPAFRTTPIIVMSGHAAFELTAYRESHCYTFLTKPFDEGVLLKLIYDLIVETLESKSPKLTIEHAGIKETILLDQILYLEYNKRNIHLHTLSGTIVFKRMTMKEISELLPEAIIQVHQSFMVHKKHIKKINRLDNNIILFDCEDIIPIGRTFKKTVIDQLFDAK